MRENKAGEEKREGGEEGIVLITNDLFGPLFIMVKERKREIEGGEAERVQIDRGDERREREEMKEARPRCLQTDDKCSFAPGP